MKLIGIGGTNGSGKDTLGEMLSERHGWLFVTVSDLLRDEARARKLPIERQTLRTISAEWRKKYGLGVLIDKAVNEYKKQGNKHVGLVISSLRNPGEADEIHRLGGQVAWIDADPQVRYKRVHSRQRSAEDKKTFEEFLAEEKIETNHGGSETALHMAAVKAKADIFIENNGDDLAAFKAEIEKALGL